MDIVSVGNGYPQSAGGLERYFYGLAQALSKAGDRVHLFTLDKPASAQAALPTWGMGDPKASLPRRLFSAQRSFAAHWPATVDVLNFHFALYARPALRFIPREVPAVFHFHGPWAEESRCEGSNPLSVGSKRWLEHQVFRRCHRFITLSHAFKQLLHISYGICEERIQVVPGGIDTDVFKPASSRRVAREQLNWPQDRFIIFTPRRLVNRMGLNDLIEAISRIRYRRPEVWVAIAGKGPLAACLQQQIEELGVSPHVRLLGFLSEEQLVRAYQASDLTVLPSLTLEGFGLALAESLACGTPAVATPVGGMPEVLAPLAPELLMPATGSAAIAGTLDDILSGGLRLPTSERCRRYAHANFDWPTVARQVRQVFVCGLPSVLPGSKSSTDGLTL